MSKRRRRMYWVCALGIGFACVVLLVLSALRENINLFYTPTQVVRGEVSGNVRIRLGGMVQRGSIKRSTGLHLEFTVTDFKEAVVVQYNGILPDLFREGQGVVVSGRFINHRFFADEVLAKHDENYMPPGVKPNRQD